MTLDPLQVAQMPKDRPLIIREAPRAFVCVLCGAPQDEGAWSVKLANRLLADPNCASDHGWTVR